MNKKTNTIDASHRHQNTDQVSATAPSSADQQLFEIRDLLFGEQQRLIQDRIQLLEKKTQQKLQEMNEAFSGALNQLREDSKAKLEELASHVEDLNRQHLSSEQSLGSDIDDLQTELSLTREELKDADSELDAHLQAEANRLMNELTVKYNEMMATLKATSDDLKNNKADRKTLASLLASVADNLNENE